MDLGLLIIVLISVSLGALIKGLTGFGFGILGTALLANFIPVQDAVTVMILPMLAVNIPLILEAKFSELRNCIENYSYFVFTGLTGAFVGVLIVEFLPVKILSIMVGTVAILYVYFKQSYFYRPETSISKCFTEKWYNQSLIGILSGTVLGASNIGLLYVTYLDRLEVDRKTFAGIVSVVILLASVIRLSLSAGTGLYTFELLKISVVAAVIGFTVSKLGAKLTHRVPSNVLEDLTLCLILVVGLRIILVNSGLI